MKKLFFLLVLLNSFSLSAQRLQPIPMDTAIRYGKLSNGLTYYIRHNEQPKERAEFYIAQKVGSILEEDSQNGLAHFLEHMAFNGTKNYPGRQLINYFETIGVRFGYNINAYTSLDETIYNLSDVPTTRNGIIDSALLVLHDWSSFISLQDDEIDKERGVIREEWRQGQDANRRLWKASSAVIMAGSPYAKRDVIGDTAIINNFSHKTLRDYYKKWYRPDLQGIFVVGDVDVNQIEAKIKSLFSDIPAPVNPAKRVYFPVPDQERPVTGVFTDPEEQTVDVELDYRFDALPDSVLLSVQGYSLNVINNLIELMVNERLNAIAHEPGTPFANINSGISNVTRTKCTFGFVAEPLTGKETEARARLLKEVEIIRRFGFTPSEFERAKTSLLSNYEKMFKEKDKQKNNSLVREYTRNFVDAEGIPGIEWEYNFIRKIIPGLPIEAVNHVAQQYLSSKGIIYVIYGPQKEGLTYPTESALVNELDATKNLALEAPKDSVSSEPLIPGKIKIGKVKKETADPTFNTTEWVLSNGVKVIFKPTTFKQDEIRLAAWSDGGTSLLSTEELPSAKYATSVINQSGLGKFNQTELSKKLTGKIAKVSPYIGIYEEGFQGASSVKDAETMLQLIHLFFTATRKDDNAYAIFEKSERTELENVELDPENAYIDSLKAIMYDHSPRILSNNVETLNKVKYETILSLYKERFANPADFTFLFVGNIDPATFKPLVEKYLGGLKTNKNRENWKDVNVRYAQGQVYREIEKKLKISKASCISNYTINLPYNLKNSLLVTTLTNILDLRYTLSIREEKGGSYGVGVFGTMPHKPIEQALLSIQFDTDPKLYKQMLDIIHSEIDSIAANGPKPEDLEKVKLNFLKQYKENTQENSWWLQALAVKYHDDVDVVNDYEKDVNAIDAEAVKSLAKKFLDGKNRTEVILLPEP
ncbi:MAG: insulinase family protein [Bacteroidota bacterium]|nr:insulinase family protein [Bacteroidota bacterium]